MLPRCLNIYRKRNGYRGGVPGFFVPFCLRLFYEPENCGAKKPGFCLRLLVENTGGACAAKKVPCGKNRGWGVFPRAFSVFSFCGGFFTRAEPGFFVPPLQGRFIKPEPAAQKRADLMSWENCGTER